MFESWISDRFEWFFVVNFLYPNFRKNRPVSCREAKSLVTELWSAAHVRKKRRTAERRFAWHVCLRHPFRPFLFGIPSIHSLSEAWGSRERQDILPATHYACIMPIPPLQLQKNTCLMQRSREFVTMQCLCSQLCYVTAANQRTLIEIEFLATVGWKRGCQPFSCPCWQNVTHCRKELCSLCTFKTFPFWNSKHRLRARSSTSSTLCFYACKRSHPFVEDSGFVSCRGAWVWSRSCGLQGLLRNIEYWKYIGSCFFPFAMRLQCVEIERLATVGWEWGCQPFSCPCSQHVTHCPKRFVRHVCLRNLFRPFRLRFPSIHSLPEARSWERQSAPPDLQYYVWVMPIPSLQLQNKICHAEKQSVWSRSCGLQDLLQVTTQCFWQNHCQDWAFSNSLSADHVRKMWGTAERRFVRHVCFRSPFLPFLLEMQCIHSLPEA